MRRFHLRFIIGLAAIGWGYAAVAQMPAPVPSAAPVPEQMPFNIPIGPSIDLAQAKELAAAAEAEAASAIGKWRSRSSIRPANPSISRRWMTRNSRRPQSRMPRPAPLPGSGVPHLPFMM